MLLLLKWLWQHLLLMLLLLIGIVLHMLLLLVVQLLLLRNLLLDMLMLSMIAHIFCWGRGDIVVLVGWLDGILVSQVLLHGSNWNQKKNNNYKGGLAKF